MGMGDDIKSVFVENGVAYTIVRDSGNISGEYLDYEPNSQVTKPFIREHFLEVDFAYDTVTVGGDIIRFDVSGESDSDKDHYLIVHHSKAIFENEVTDIEGVLYKTNIFGTFLRPSGELATSSYRTITNWTTHKTDVRGILTDKLYGTFLDDESQLVAQVDIKSLLLYVPSSIEPMVHDRFFISGENLTALSGSEYYAVKYLEVHSHKGVTKVYLEEDTRE